jgi:lysophospholipase L1-like esterase
MEREDIFKTLVEIQMRDRSTFEWNLSRLYDFFNHPVYGENVMRKWSVYFRLMICTAAALLLFAVASVYAQPAATLDAPPAATVVAPQPVAVVPVPRDARWKQRHDKMNDRVKQGNVDLLLIGDSITQGWEGAGKEVWAKYYAKRNAVNLGIGGDQTQHVLWRLENGNIDGISPKLAIIMIGTNNAGGKQKAADIAAGVKAIVEKLREKLPQTKLLLLAIFPRGADDQDPRREDKMKFNDTNVEVNEIIAKLADNKMIYYMDINDKLLNSDHKLTKEIMPDYLHPNAKGYAIWAEAIEPTVEKLMGEK